MDRKTVLLDEAQLERQREYTRQLAALHQQRGKPVYALVDTFGCQQNVADSQHILGMLRDMGCQFTDDAAQADIVVLNTCAIRDHAEKRVYGNLGALTHTKKQNPEQVICLCGCMAQRPEVAEKVRQSYRHVDLVFGPQALWKFPELLYRVYTRRGRVFSVEDEHGTIAEGMPVVREGNVRAWVSIMYGCNNFCSYCIVPYVRGRERSRDKAAVLALQRHDVCNRAEADEIAIAPGDAVLIAAERSGQFEGDADAGEHRVRIRPVRPVRVHNGRALRQLLLALMMVRDDERHAQLPAEPGLLQRRDAAVHRDDEPHALRMELADGPGVQAVALLEPPGDVDDAVRTYAAQKIRQQAGGRDAVHVIIAEHGDALPELQRLPHRLHGAVHLPQEKGVKQRRVRAQQLLRLLRSPAAAPGQHARRQRRIARLLQRIDRGAVRQGGVPDSVLHTRYTS